jgi:hypothetical protein
VINILYGIRRVDYSLTQKGRGLLPVLEQIAAFSMRFCSKDVIIEAKPRKYADGQQRNASIYCHFTLLSLIFFLMLLQFLSKYALLSFR